MGERESAHITKYTHGGLDDGCRPRLQLATTLHVLCVLQCTAPGTL